MTVSAAIQILPKTETSMEIIRIVDEVIAYIKSTGINYYVGPFETTFESDDFDLVMEIIANCQKIAIASGCDSVSSYVKIVYNPKGGVLTIDEKISKYNG